MTARMMRGRCVQGLGFSGGAEVQVLFDRWWAHPEEVAALDMDDGCVADTVCRLWSIQRHGWEKAVDEVLCHLDGVMAEWLAWKRTPQGQAWLTEWAPKVAALRTAQPQR